MNYYRLGEGYCGSLLPLELPAAGEEEALAAAGVLPVVTEGDPARTRASWKVTHPAQLGCPPEGPAWLDADRLPAGAPLPPALAARLEEGTLMGVNRRWAGWERRAAPPARRRLRLNLLALGDVGGTLLIGLKLLGREALESIGICDISPQMCQRWEYEMNQTTYPWDYDALPPVEIIPPERLFDGDVFVFCASKGIPPVGSQVKDVRMAQMEGNLSIIRPYARMAREKGFEGLFAVVSDPVDILCKGAWFYSNQGEDGAFDGLGLRPEQVQGYGLGVMNGRAAYYAKKDPRFASFLTQGRAYGPHGQGLVIANSIGRYDDALSRELTQLALEANLRTRETGFKPYVAPALSSGAISLVLTLEGKWHYSSNFLGGVWMGCKNRWTPAGLELESLPLPDALFARLAETWEGLGTIL